MSRMSAAKSARVQRWPAKALVGGALLFCVTGSGLSQTHPEPNTFFKQYIGLKDDQIANIGHGKAVAQLLILLVQERAVPVAATSKIDVNLRHFPKPYWNYLLVTALFGIGNSSTSFLILQTKSIGASFETTILIYAGFNLVAARISYPAGSLSDRWGRRRVLLLSFIIFFIAYLGFARAKSVPLIATLVVFYGSFQGIFRSVGKAFASDFVPERLRASGVGWYSTTVGLLGSVANVVAGLLWDRIGHAAVFYYGATFAVVGSIGLLVLVPGGQNNRPEAAAR